MENIIKHSECPACESKVSVDIETPQRQITSNDWEPLTGRGTSFVVNGIPSVTWKCTNNKCKASKQWNEGGDYT